MITKTLDEQRDDVGRAIEGVAAAVEVAARSELMQLWPVPRTGLATLVHQTGKRTVPLDDELEAEVECLIFVTINQIGNP